MVPAPLGGGAKTSKISAIFKNLLLYSWTSSSQTVGMIVISIKSSTKIVKFMAPGSGVLVLGQGYIDYVVKVHKFFETPLFFFWSLDKLTKCIVELKMTASSKIVNLMTPGSGVLVLGRGHIDYSENAIIL